MEHCNHSREIGYKCVFTNDADMKGLRQLAEAYDLYPELKHSDGVYKNGVLGSSIRGTAVLITSYAKLDGYYICGNTKTASDMKSLIFQEADVIIPELKNNHSFTCKYGFYTDEGYFLDRIEICRFLSILGISELSYFKLIGYSFEDIAEIACRDITTPVTPSNRRKPRPMKLSEIALRKRTFGNLNV